MQRLALFVTTLLATATACDSPQERSRNASTAPPSSDGRTLYTRFAETGEPFSPVLASVIDRDPFFGGEVAADIMIAAANDTWMPNAAPVTTTTFDYCPPGARRFGAMHGQLVEASLIGTKNFADYMPFAVAFHTKLQRHVAKTYANIPDDTMRAFEWKLNPNIELAPAGRYSPFSARDDSNVLIGHWRSRFYHIAHYPDSEILAGPPVTQAYKEYQRKRRRFNRCALDGAIEATSVGRIYW